MALSKETGKRRGYEKIADIRKGQDLRERLTSGSIRPEDMDEQTRAWLRFLFQDNGLHNDFLDFIYPKDKRKKWRAYGRRVNNTGRTVTGGRTTRTTRKAA
jgi:hypothetical protein